MESSPRPPEPEIITQLRMRLRSRTRPFPPFAVKFAGGKSHRITKPFAMAVARSYVVYFDRFDRMFTVPAGDILELVDLKPPSTRRQTR